MPLGAFRLNGLARRVVAAVLGRDPITVTAVGNVEVSTAQSQFGGASAYFTTGEDSLRVSGGIDQSTFTSNWTFECWVRMETIQDNQYLIYNRGIVWITGPNRSTQANKIVVALSSTPGATEAFYTSFSTITWQTNQWYHIAVAHDTGTTTVYVDGTSIGSVSTNAYLLTTARDLDFGKHLTVANNDLNGYMDEIRISKVTRYTANFTPSTTPFVNDANTLLLLHMDGTDGSTFFEDDNGVRTKNGISAVGNAEVSTAQSKFGGASGKFGGSGNLLNVSRSEFWKLGTEIQNWTIEGWIYLNVNENSTRGLMNSSTFGTSNGWGIILSAGKKIGWRGNATGAGGGSLTSSTNLPTFEWAHFSIVRSGTTLTIYNNGTQVAQQTSYSNQTDVEKILEIGRSGSISSGNWVSQLVAPNCFLDEIRISNTARYTANFTAPTAPFQNDANTLLLLHMDGTNGSTDFPDDNS